MAQIKIIQMQAGLFGTDVGSTVTHVDESCWEEGGLPG